MEHERFVAAMAKSLELSFHHRQVDIAQLARDQGGSIEAIARRERYAFLKEASAIAGAKWILTGHTADDQAETLLLNLLRGAGPRGLGGMLPVGPGQVCRPLLSTTKNEVLAYLEDNSIPFEQDPTNQDLSLTRNKIRRELIPVLERDFNPAVRRVLAREAELFAAIDDHLTEQGHVLYRNCLISDEPLSVTIDGKKLGRETLTLIRAAIRALLEDLVGDLREITRAHVDEIAQAVGRSSGSESMDLPRGIHIRREYSQIVFGITQTPPPQNHPGTAIIHIEQPGKIRWGALEIRWDGGTAGALGDHAQAFDRDALHPPLTLRAAGPGDRMEPEGMTGSQKLSDLFINRKIPRSRRPFVPLLCDHGGPNKTERILWAVGIRRSKHALPEQSKPSLTFNTRSG